MWDKAVECVYCETNDHHNEKAKANGPDLSMLTMNLYCTYNNNNKENVIVKDVGAQQFTYLVIVFGIWYLVFGFWFLVFIFSWLLN